MLKPVRAFSNEKLQTFKKTTSYTNPVINCNLCKQSFCQETKPSFYQNYNKIFDLLSKTSANIVTRRSTQVKDSSYQGKVVEISDKIKEGIQINHSIGRESGSYLSDKVDDDKKVRIGE